MLHDDGGASEASWDYAHGVPPTYVGTLCEHEHGKALFAHAAHRWRQAIVAWLPEEATSLRSMAKYAPLAAAIIAPTSTLLDIPALAVSLSHSPVQATTY